VLSEVVVETCVEEGSLGELIRHELRWLRTIRTVRPMGYHFSFLSFGWGRPSSGALLAAGTRRPLTMLAITAIARIMLIPAPALPVRLWRSSGWCRSMTCSSLPVVLGLRYAARTMRHARYRVARRWLYAPDPLTDCRKSPAAAFERDPKA